MIKFTDFSSATLITSDKSDRVADITNDRVTLYEDGHDYMRRDKAFVTGNLDYVAKCSMGFFWVESG